ncbi:hypothetical protein TNCV_1707521 [Trichonephila clavipes]|uniref:Histone-lysine N-methyltransferase SETMAR n=1 Tax=Trichonephila clavipes TaxID=2585209 RepID=A0A8X6UTY2_TRICX|nr:hypothetical protein TNCV_1707521 [Trichonephila clavipes]
MSSIPELLKTRRVGQRFTLNLSKAETSSRWCGVGLTLNSFRYLLSTTEPFEAMTDQKRPELASRRGVVFHQDNATPHTFVVTRQTLWELGW